MGDTSFNEGDSKFNKSLDDLHRISNLQDMANQASCHSQTWDGVRIWRDLIACLHREILPYINDKERSKLDGLKITTIPPRNIQRMIGQPGTKIRDDLDTWQQEINSLIKQKGMGIIAEQALRDRMLK